MLVLCAQVGCTTGLEGDAFEAICGDGRWEGIEACDDGNRTDGDGCSAACTAETSYLCAPAACPCDQTPACDTGCACDLTCPGGAATSSCRANGRCRRLPSEQQPTAVWRQRCVPFSVNEAVDERSELSAAIPRAMSAWSAPCSDIELRLEGRTQAQRATSSTTATRNVNVIELVTSPQTLAERTIPPEFVGAAFSSYIIATGELLDVDIVLNGVNFQFMEACGGGPRTVGPQNVLAYMFGEGLGFSGIADETSIMNREVDMCRVDDAALSPADRGLLCSVYPRGRESNTCRPPPDGYLEGTPDGREIALVRAECKP